MLQFFRKIRRQLLTENKFNQYILYAIGEILLVVIGILLALQINNWNESNKNNALQINYMKGLISDLDYDIRSYSLGIEEIDRHRASADALLMCYKDNTTLPDSVLIEHMSNMVIISRFDHRNTVMDDMKSAGRLNLISSDSIRQRIISYYNLARAVIDGSERNNEWILNHIIASPDYTGAFDFNSTVAATKRFPPMMKSIEVSPFDGLPLINDPDHPGRENNINLITAKNMLEGINKSSGLRVREEAESLKILLEEYLNEIEN